MKRHETGPYIVGQRLLHRVGKKISPVTFVSLGPRLGKAVGKDAVTQNPQTAIVRDAHGDLMTVRLADLEPAPRKDDQGA